MNTRLDQSLGALDTLLSMDLVPIELVVRLPYFSESTVRKSGTQDEELGLVGDREREDAKPRRRVRKPATSQSKLANRSDVLDDGWRYCELTIECDDQGFWIAAIVVDVAFEQAFELFASPEAEDRYITDLVRASATDQPPTDIVSGAIAQGDDAVDIDTGAGFSGL